LDPGLLLPFVRLGVNISPRLVLELTAGSIAYEVSGRWTLIDAGARWHLTGGSLSPTSSPTPTGTPGSRHWQVLGTV
jgi:hypothetical protein